MGLESYRLGVKFKNTPKIKDVVEILTKLEGIIISSKSNEDKEIEFIFSEGIIEVIVSTIKDQNKIVEQITGKKCNTIKVNTKDLGKTRMTLRFAKPNSIELVDKMIELLKKIDNYIPIEFVGDIESKHEVNLDNYEDLKIRVTKAKEEFNKWFPNIQCPIRCIDVFKNIRDIQNNS